MDRVIAAMTGLHPWEVTGCLDAPIEHPSEVAEYVDTAVD